MKREESKEELESRLNLVAEEERRQRGQMEQITHDITRIKKVNIHG